MVRAVLAGEGFDGLALAGHRENVVVRASVVRRLLIGSLGQIVDPLGIRLSNVLIEDPLLLDHLQLDLPLALTGTHFTDPISLREARLKSLDLTSSEFPQLNAGGIEVASSASLRDVVVRSHGRHDPAVRLSGAHVRGTLWLERLDVAHTEDAAFVANRLNVEGAIVFEQAQLTSAATRGVILAVGAHVGGSIFGLGLIATNTGRGPAIRLASSRVGEDLILNHSNIKAEGGSATDLVGLHVGGDLMLREAIVASVGRCAVEADRVHIGGRLWLEGAKMSGHGRQGAVRIAGADIGDSIRAADARLTNQGGPALYADHARAAAAISLNAGFRARGAGDHAALRLGGVRTTYIDLTASQIINPDGASIDFRQTRLDSIRIPADAVCHTVTSAGDWAPDGFMLLDGFEYRAFTEPSASVEDWLSWLRRLATHNTDHEFASQPYMHLAHLYTKSGRAQESRRVAMAQYEHLRARGKLGFWRRLGNRLLGLSIGHGYQPYRSVYALLVLLALTTGVVSVGADRSLFTPVGNSIPSHTQVRDCRGDYPCLSPFFYATETVFPLLDLHQAEYWQPSQRDDAGRALAIWLRIASLLGWALATLSVAAFVSLARSEV
jgi:hypothetical protein